MVEIKKCLDTYALIEISRGNSKFADYLNSHFVITDLTLAEFYAVFLREDGKKSPIIGSKNWKDIPFP